MENCGSRNQFRTSMGQPPTLFVACEHPKGHANEWHLAHGAGRIWEWREHPYDLRVSFDKGSVSAGPSTV